MAEPCDECKECKDTRKIVSGMKDELHSHVLKTATKLDKHEQKINSLESTSNNTYRTIEDIKTTMKEGFDKQERQLTEHKKEESVETEALKEYIKGVEANILKAFAPVKAMTDKNAGFITKAVYMVSGGLAISYGLWWLHKNGLMIIALPGGTGG